MSEKDSIKEAFSREWREVQEKYPLVAATYVSQMIELYYSKEEQSDDDQSEGFQFIWEHDMPFVVAGVASREELLEKAVELQRSINACFRNFDRDVDREDPNAGNNFSNCWKAAIGG